MDYRVYIKTPGYSIGASSVIVTGLVPSVTNVILAGIKFKFESDSTDYTVSSNVNSNSSGETTLAFTPTLAITATTDLPLLLQSPRDLTSAIKTQTQAQVAKFAYAMQFEFSGQTVCINDSPQDLRFFNPELGTPAVNGAGQTGTSLNIKNCVKDSIIFRHGESFYIDNIAQQYTVNTSILDTVLNITESPATWYTIADVLKTFDPNIKITVDSSIKDGYIVAWHNFSSTQDLRSFDNLKFQIKSNQALKSGDFMLVLSLRKNCNYMIDYFPIPELTVGNWSDIDYVLPFKDSSVMGEIKSLGILLNTTLLATTQIWLRSIKTTKNNIVSDSSGNAVITLSPAVSSPSNDLVLHRNWSGVGGYFGFDAINESTDLKGNYVEIKLSACDQSVLQLILTNNYIGRLFRAYKLYLTSGQIVSKPIVLHIGYMHGGFEFNSEYSEDDRSKTDTLSGRIQDILSARRKIVGIQTNNESLQLHHPNDKFFKEVPNLVHKAIVWGDTKSDSGGGMCLLATTVFKVVGGLDDCRELKILRDFRDNVLMSFEEGQKLVENYNQNKQSYIDYIESLPNKMTYYNNIYDLVLQAIVAIKKEDYRKAINLYDIIVLPLKYEITYAIIN
ncbi:MAG: hypothetical protein Q8P20_01280 [bacterium]|nr:hypothetical protein [bacterium]